MGNEYPDHIPSYALEANGPLNVQYYTYNIYILLK